MMMRTILRHDKISRAPLLSQRRSRAWTLNTLGALNRLGTRDIVKSFLVLLVAAAAFTLSSCGKGDSGGKDKEAGGDIWALQDEVNGLLEDASKAGMEKIAASDYKRVQKYLAEADKFISDEGDERKGRSKLLLAKRKLESFVSDQKKIEEALAKTATLRKETEALKKKAEGMKAATVAADTYKQAMNSYESAVETIKKRESSRAIGRARSQMERAKTYFTQAIEAATEGLKFKKRAEEEKTTVANWKKKAAAKDAENKASQSWLEARAVEKDADDYFDRGEYSMAVDSYKEAARRYVSALEAIKQQEQLAKMQAEQAKREKEYLAKLQAQQEGAPGGAPVDVTPAPGLEGGVEPEAAPAEVNPSVEAVGIGEAPSDVSIDLFEGFDPAKYPQRLDAEDEAYLEMNYRKLVKSGAIEYDPQTGAVQIDYANADNARKDLIPLTKSTRVQFKSEFDSGTRRRRGGNPLAPGAGGAEEDNSPFSFRGDTSGFVAFRVPLKYYVRIEYNMRIVTMDKTGTFTAAAMLNPKKGYSGYAAQWLNVGILQGGRPKVGGAPPPYNAVADRWFEKKRDVAMLIEYRMPDPTKEGDPLKSGRFTVTYDVDGDATAHNSFSSKRYTSGVVGFQWYRTKFQVKDLLITGILDKAEAVAMLRASLGDKKK